MVLKIDKNISGLICAISIIYLTVLALYSIVPSIFTTLKDTPIIYSAYWLNHIIFFSFIPYLSSKFIINKKTVTLLRLISIFVIIIGLFQITNCFVYIQDVIWISLSCLCIVTILMYYKYGS